MHGSIPDATYSYYHKSGFSGVFQGLPEPTKPTAPRPLLSLYGIIYVTWYTSDLSYRSQTAVA